VRKFRPTEPGLGKRDPVLEIEVDLQAVLGACREQRILAGLPDVAYDQGQRTRDKVTLPPSLAGFEFDLVMLDGERMLLCQVKSRASARSRDLEAIAAAARTARNITFDIIWFGDTPDLPPRGDQVRDYAARRSLCWKLGRAKPRS